MSSPIERAAELSVSRACGFGLLATGTTMIGFTSQLSLAFRFGGFALLLMCAVLMLKAAWVRRQPYKSTETWLILSRDDRPPSDVAQQMISTALRDVYVAYARFCAIASAGLLASSLLMGALAGR